MSSAVRLHRIVLAAALAVPSVLFAAAVWQNHEDVLREGHDSIERTAAIMQEHARKVFETAELAIGQVTERVDNVPWATIATPATNDFLARLKAPMDQLVSIWIADATGTVRAGSQPWPAGSGISGRNFFQVHRTATGPLYVGQPFTGAATATASFAISHGRRTPEGEFDGTVHVAVSPAYFSRFYEEATPKTPHRALLVRDDGVILARHPTVEGRTRLDADSPLMHSIAAGSTEGQFSEVGTDGVIQDYALRRIGPYPAYVAYAVAHPILLARWYRNLRIYGAVAAAAALTLLFVSWLALRRAVAEQAALAALRAETRQRAAAEQQLRHAQRMDAVGQLTGGVAHDFNNLLTAILGNLELIQRAAGLPDGRDRIIRLSSVAMKAVQRGASLTKSLLAFARKQPLQPRPIDANALLAEFLDLVRQATGPTIEVRFEPEPGLPHCLADPAELEAAILNLSINARDAHAGPGKDGNPAPGRWLRFRTAAVALDAAALSANPEARPGRFVAIEVSDNGPGMAPEVVAKAFEPFFTTKPIGQGTGLGLSQVYGFARQLGGHVTLHSTPGCGTTLTLYIPVAADG